MVADFGGINYSKTQTHTMNILSAWSVPGSGRLIFRLGTGLGVPKMSMTEEKRHLVCGKQI